MKPIPVNLFIPCLVDQFLPDIGFATAECLRIAGVEVRYDPRPTCCGQVFLNSGRMRDAARLARRFVRCFADSDAVVAPSWSCVETIRQRYGEILRDPGLVREWEALRPRISELTDFLIGACGIHRWPTPARLADPVRFRAILHWSCHMPRDEGTRRAVEGLLAGVGGVVWLPRPPDECCGFGGVFMLMWREVSAAMGQRRLRLLMQDRPDLVVLGEPGCILQMRSVAPEGVRVLHVAQLLAQAAKADREHSFD